jgi:hypothetical protein
MKEQHLRITIKDENGNTFKTTYRQPIHAVKPMVSASRMESMTTNITMNTNVGERVYWHECDMYHTKRSGVVTEAIPLIWDYSKPVGQRAIF